MLWVAAAGPAANLVMAIFWVLMVKLSFMEFTGSLFAAAGADGRGGRAGECDPDGAQPAADSPARRRAHRGQSAASSSQAYQFSRIEPYGLFIIIGLMLHESARLRVVATGGDHHRRRVGTCVERFVRLIFINSPC